MAAMIGRGAESWRGVERRAPFLATGLIAIAMAIGSAACAETADEPPDEPPGLSRGDKMLLLNGGAAAGLIAWGSYKWDYGQRDPHTQSEGWFGFDTGEGGADKLGHVWSSYALSHLFATIYEDWGYSRAEATTYGTLSSVGFQTLMEFGDSFSNHGFSYEDMLANFVGAGIGYLLRDQPQLGTKIDLRLEFAPSLDGGNDSDIFTDYEHQKMLVALKGSGFENLEGTLFEYLEFHMGYYTRGYDDFLAGGAETRRRTLYVGVGLNVTKLLSHVWETRLFNYIQVPGTYVPLEYKFDQ